MEITQDHPAAAYLLLARRYLEAGDVERCDDAFGKAVQEIGRADGYEDALCIAVQEEHLEALMRLGRRALACERCETYLGENPPGPPALRVMHAEILSSLALHDRAHAEVVDLAAHEDALSQEERARLHRVRGLALANDGRTDEAVRHLHTAHGLFDGPESSVHRERLLEEMNLFLGREGYIPPRFDRTAETVPDHLHRAETLRRQARYEEAFDTLVQALSLPDFEPVMYWPVLCEMTVLAWALRRPDLVERLRPLLQEAADHATVPNAHDQARWLLEPEATEGGPTARRFDARIDHVIRLIHDERLEEAETLLKDLREEAWSPRARALWHLAAAQAEAAQERMTGDPRHLRECAGHGAFAWALAWPDALMEVRIAAVRLVGDAVARLDPPDSCARAVEFWARAHRLEEQVAGRQPTDALRIGMLRAAPDEYDQRIRFAVERTERRRTPDAAEIAVAMEAARGAQILGQIMPAGEYRARDLPLPGDREGARRWRRAMTAALPRDQAVWLIHATPDKVHHTILTRTVMTHVYVDGDRNELAEAIEDLSLCWELPETLEASVAAGEFDRRLDRIAALLRVGEVIELLPPQVRRLAAVAGNEVSNVPLAALPLPDGGGPLGLRYALSDLPCLSAMPWLRRRSEGQRGDGVLLVAPDAGLEATRMRARTRLAGDDATPEGLGKALAQERRHRIVRIDAHGGHGHGDARLSVLELSPKGPEGHLHAEGLERMDLSSCGTLVLGACESGMLQRIGHDERTGFVRAAFNAGAAAVVAARWIAPDAVAAALLDRFQRHLRRLPRDLALHAAMRDVQDMDLAVPHPRHPSRWACWSLYGDAGLQTKAGPLRRRLRGLSERSPGKEGKR